MAFTRNLAAMAQTDHDILVVGGGASGAFIAWEAALRGMKVALVEMQDFAHATSAGNSRLVHGGLRYLKNFQFDVVRESLAERRYWEAQAPHLVHPLEFVVPTGLPDTTGALSLRIGLGLYDLLSFDRNRLDDPDKHLPGHRKVSRQEIADIAPDLDQQNLTGGISYFDCQMPMPERLALAALTGANKKGAHIVNHAKLLSLTSDAKCVTGAVVEDRHTGQLHDIKAKLVINATGPWADQINDHDQSKDQQSMNQKAIGQGRRLIRSSGIHIVTRDLSNGKALTYIGKDGHFFVLPWRGFSLIGTTDNLYDGDPADYRVTAGEIDGLLRLLAKGLPGAELSRADILFAYGGLRPLVGDTDSQVADTYKASRKSDLVDHGAEGGKKGFYTVLGGKWTTSRHLAEKVVNQIEGQLHKRSTSRSKDTPLDGAPATFLKNYQQQLCADHADWPEHILFRLIELYGTGAKQVIALAQETSTQTVILDGHEPVIAAQILYAIRSEMAGDFADIMWRRLGVGLTGKPADSVIDAILDIAAGEFGWDETEKTAQRNIYVTVFDKLPIGPAKTTDNTSITSGDPA